MTARTPLAGVIEGFYGRPWSHDERLEMIDFLAEVGLNTFIYSPKNDLFTRQRWRDPYPEREAAELAELVTRAHAVGVDVHFALSPGLSMRYSDPADTDAILAKFAQVADVGIDGFELFLDDIPEVLQHGPDRSAFGSLVEAQIAVVGEVWTRLRASHPDARFAVCPTQYWGHGDEEYISALGQSLPADVGLYWTGRAICAPELQAADARVFAEHTGHPPLYWDNFPVNDVAMTGELHIGPYLGREAEIPALAHGVIANAMPLAEASKIAFCSLADFMSDPEGFDAEASWEAAIARIAGPRDAAALREFADACRGSALCTDDAPRLAAHLERFAFQYQFEDQVTAVAELRSRVAAMLEVTAPLDAPENARLGAEIAPWLAQYRRGLQSLLTAIDLIPTTGRGVPASLEGSDRDVVAALLEEFRSHRLRVFGDVLDMFLSDLSGEFTPR